MQQTLSAQHHHGLLCLSVRLQYACPAVCTPGNEGGFPPRGLPDAFLPCIER